MDYSSTNVAKNSVDILHWNNNSVLTSLTADNSTAPPCLRFTASYCLWFFSFSFSHTINDILMIPHLPFIFLSLTGVQSFLAITKKAAVQSSSLPLFITNIKFLNPYCFLFQGILKIMMMMKPIALHCLFPLLLIQSDLPISCHIRVTSIHLPLLQLPHGLL